MYGWRGLSGALGGGGMLGCTQWQTDTGNADMSYTLEAQTYNFETNVGIVRH